MTETLQHAMTALRRRQRRESPRDAALLGFAGVLIVVVTAPVRPQAAPMWRLTLPFVPSPGGPVFSWVSFLAGMLMLGFGWLWLAAFARDTAIDGARRLRLSSLVIVLWSLPIVLGPPLLSNDVYSYAAQGELASRGVDVTRVGPIALGGGPFLRAADSFWHHNPSPYGPVWNKLAAAVVTVTGHDAAGAVWGFRFVVAVSLVFSGWIIARFARELGADPAFAVVLGAGNPLVLIHMLGGIHNDALMMALLLGGLYCARRRHRWSALVLITAAAAVKLPAAAGLAYLGWNWRDELDTRAKRLLGALVTGVVGAFLIVWLSVEVRMGMGWLGALRGTSKVMSTYAPATMAGLVTSDLLHLFGLPVSASRLVNVFRGFGLLAAGGLGWLLLYNCRRIGSEVALGLTLVLVVVFGPVLWPWYLPPAVALLAISGAKHYWPALSVCCISLSLFVFPTSAGSDAIAGQKAVVGMVVVAAVVGGSLLAQRVAGEPVVPPALARRLSRRVEQPSPEPAVAA